jgi:hypothetical protein
MQVDYIKSVDLENKIELENLFHSNSIKSIYQHPDYIENISNTSYVFLLKENKIIKSYCFVNEYALSKLNFIKFSKIKFGSIGSDEHSRVLDLEIINFYKSNKITFVIYIPFENKIFETINQKKIKTKTSVRLTGTLILDLRQNISEISKKYSTNLNRNLKKSKKNNLIVSELFFEHEFDKLNQIYNTLFEYRNIKVSNSCFTNDIIKFVTNKKNGFVMGCFENNELIGGAVFIENNGRIEYFIGASNPEFRNLPILHSVFHEAIILSQKRGYSFFDFGGVVFSKEDIQLNNITKFKYQFCDNSIFYNKDFEIVLSGYKKKIYDLYLKISNKLNG